MSAPRRHCMRFLATLLCLRPVIGVVEVPRGESDALALIQKAAFVHAVRDGRAGRVAAVSAEQGVRNVGPPMPASGPPGTSQTVAGESVPAKAYGGHVDTSKERIFLFVVAHAFHGSTALEGILMSSHKLATLCASRVSQCEGGNLMQQQGASHEAREWDFSQALSVFADVWDVKRPVLLDKTPNLIHDVPKVYDGFLKANLPVTLQNEGVQRLRQAYVLMWRPSCLWQLSSHAKDYVKQKGTHDYALKELDRYEDLVSTYKFLVDAGVPALVMNLGDVIWKPRWSVDRLQEFLPQLGKLDADYVPELGRDVWADNYWKADGSVVSFGGRTSAIDHGYDAEEAVCDSTQSLFHGSDLTIAEQKRGAKAEAALKSWS